MSPGLTIFPQNGRIMFPVLEPFGSSLTNRIDDPELQEFYSYQDLYDTTLVRAREVTRIKTGFHQGNL